jgi:DNA-binding NarL/FixJ family response regulator
MAMGRARPIKVLLVDDQAIVRMGLAALFGTAPHIAVVGEAATGTDALVEARRCRPDVILMDVRLPERSGIEACREIRSEQPHVRVLMLTSYTDEEAVLAAILAGAAGYILKTCDPARLIEAVEIVAANGSLLDPTVTVAVMNRLRQGSGGPADDRLSALSEQERRILPLIAEGKTNRQIADELFVSEHTVKGYVRAAFSKLQVSRRSQLAALVARRPASSSGADE